MNRESLSAPVFVATGESYYQNPIMQQHSDQTTDDPEIEVMALSSETLMSKNKFTCEICNKSFLRGQNLQLHKRKHKNVFKLEYISSSSSYSCNKNKQVSNKNRKKVYVCPELTCLHHHRSHAIGDLAGIKKHYQRKHGEKKWKCENCLRSYAVQSDWKAHSKICGSTDYRCDCGSNFPRHDKFIAHLAICDAFSPEASQNPTAAATGKRRLFKKITSLSVDSLSHQITRPAVQETSNSSPNNTNEQEQRSKNGGTESDKPIPPTDLFTDEEFLVDDLMNIDFFSDPTGFFYDSNYFAHSALEENALFPCDALLDVSESDIIIQNFVSEKHSNGDRDFASSFSSSTTGMKSSKEDAEDDDEFLRDHFDVEGFEQSSLFDGFEDNLEERFLSQNLGHGF